MSEDYPEFSEEMVKHINEPFEGLFGNNVQTRVVQELTADPYNIFRPKDLEILTDASTPSIRRSLSNLVNLKLVVKSEEDSQHPIYRVNSNSKIIDALTFLSLALIDDKENTDCMEQAIREYCIQKDIFPYAQATTDDFDVIEDSTTNYVGDEENTYSINVSGSA